ncbi:MAG TPA: SDR family NAD(P)-dependent oxidoreductase [Candidatus Egerieousia sp.]|nr:SDR family NAD(P)-dependent oxidoreductase [Candidatus Egerieousia sp.]HPT05949.1 SDR family NAD(P)-dependent oxidoreductase [Candidatus Egerieousia sp.]
MEKDNKTQNNNSPQRVAVITGATGEIGAEVCKYLVINGYKVYALCRNTQKAEALKGECAKICREKNINPAPNFHIVPADLEDFESVDNAIKYIIKVLEKKEWEETSIDLLINNAGVIAPTMKLTKDLQETMLQVNYLAPRRIATSLLPYMNEENGKIINTVSVTINWWPLDDDDRKFSNLKNYSRSKLCLALFTIAINRKLLKQHSRVRAIAADPGVVNTKMITMHKWYDSLADKLFRPFIKSPARGAKAIINAINCTEKGETRLCKERKIVTFKSGIYKELDKNKEKFKIK